MKTKTLPVGSVCRVKSLRGRPVGLILRYVEPHGVQVELRGLNQRVHVLRHEIESYEDDDGAQLSFPVPGMIGRELPQRG